MRFRTILLDFDHTLLDSDISMTAAYSAAASTATIDRPADHHADFQRINDELWRAVERGEISPNEVKVRRFERFLVHLGRADEATTLAPLMAEAFVVGLIEHGELYPGAEQLLDLLADRPLALVTNGIGRVQRGRLERLGLADRFDSIAISGELGMAKPARAIFDHTLDELGQHDRSSVAMIGDSWASDVRGALNAEVSPVWFNRHGALPPDTDAEIGVSQAATLDEVAALVSE